MMFLPAVGNSLSGRGFVSPTTDKENRWWTIELACLVAKQCPETTAQVPRSRPGAWGWALS